MMRRVVPATFVAIALAAVVACGQAGPSATSAPPVSATASPSPVPSPSAAAPSAAACIDVGELADSADPVENALTQVDGMLATGNATGARDAATTAVVGMRKLVASVSAGSPAAATQFAAAADELEQAAAAFPGGGDGYTKAKADFEAAFNTARASACH